VQKAANSVTFSLKEELVRPDVPSSPPYLYYCTIAYVATLNDLAIRSQYQTNRATIVVQGTNRTLTKPGPHAELEVDGVRINDSTPALECEQFVSSSTGLPGDQRTIAVVARNIGNVFLTNI